MIAGCTGNNENINSQYSLVHPDKEVLKYFCIGKENSKKVNQLNKKLIRTTENYC
jgi:hypothetical protein